MIITGQQTIYSDYYNARFADIYPDFQAFKTAQGESKIPLKISQANFQTLYYLMRARWLDSHIKASSIGGFTRRVALTIFQHGPQWQKKLALQDELRNIDLQTARVGDTFINNHAYNPSTQPSTATLTQLPTIDDQVAHKKLKGSVQAIRDLWLMLEEDPTQQFLNKFQPLFISIAASQFAPTYDTTELETYIGG